MMRYLPEPLQALAAFNQFILYQIVPNPKTGKNTKYPIDHKTFARCDSQNPLNWLSAKEACVYASTAGDAFGVGFVFTQNDPFYFIDIDQCLTDSGWSDIANNLLSYCPGASVEVSQSGTGLHIIGMYSGVEPDHSCKNTMLNIEMYTSGRFVALTGAGAIGAANVVNDLNQVINTYFPPKITAGDPAEWTATPVDEWHGPVDDNALINKMLKSKSAAASFGGKSSFADLWSGDISGYNDDESAAEMALIQHLAFWTGKDCDRIFRLMYRSGMVRDKWNRPDYLKRSILNAVSQQVKVAGSGVKPEAVTNTITTVDSTPELVTGFQYLNADSQIEHFNQCVYIINNHTAFTPAGELKSEQFNAVYGGYVFQFDADADNTTKKAWEAFTESQAVRFPKVHSTCFNPGMGYGEVVQRDGMTAVNTYKPVQVPSQSGDVSLFLNHLRIVLPNPRDQMILLCWMAACVQNLGVKIRWMPLLQGVEGNGKTLFNEVLIEAIGKVYSHVPSAQDFGGKFNGYMKNKLLIAIEDIYIPEHRLEVMEYIKPWISNDGLEIQGKGADQVMSENFIRFIANSNHKGAVRKTENDRRVCVFYTAQQEKAHLHRDGLTATYFKNLYDWLKSGGYANVTHFLQNYEINEEFNPAGLCQTAPESSSTREAIVDSLGSVEQQIIEAIEEEKPGFRGGWVSSRALSMLLDQLRKTNHIPPNKYRQLMKTLGYDYHPGLKDGRVNNAVLFDEGKPRLYIKQGHIHQNLTQPCEISRLYESAQNNGNPMLTLSSIRNNIR